MDNFKFEPFEFQNLGKLNIIVGKNGSGKSTVLKKADEYAYHSKTLTNWRYISPERGGTLKYEPNVDNNIATSQGWLENTRRVNQAQQFKTQSIAIFRQTELDFLRAIESAQFEIDYTPKTFNSVIDQLNTLLDHVRVERSKSVITIKRKSDEFEVDPSQISSGEAEALALGMEVISFCARCRANPGPALLFIDEPDVHLHPDLQHRLAAFIANEIQDVDVQVVVATHSTSFAAGLLTTPDVKVAFFNSGQTVVEFEPLDDITSKVLPVFGVHPLSNVFNSKPILLVEGDDDLRIWEQACRSSAGAINVSPCVAGDVQSLGKFEKRASHIMAAVYDGARGYSLRDRDGVVSDEPLDDIGCIRRFRLSCRTAENLLLTDEALQTCGSDWPSFSSAVATFVANNPTHFARDELSKFLTEPTARKSWRLKDIRNILTGLLTNKPWEVLVGQAIAKSKREGASGEGTVRDFLGEGLWSQLNTGF